jgi:hypothetical protein
VGRGCPLLLTRIAGMQVGAQARPEQAPVARCPPRPPMALPPALCQCRPAAPGQQGSLRVRGGARPGESTPTALAPHHASAPHSRPRTGAGPSQGPTARSPPLSRAPAAAWGQRVRLRRLALPQRARWRRAPRRPRLRHDGRWRYGAGQARPLSRGAEDRGPPPLSGGTLRGGTRQRSWRQGGSPCGPWRGGWGANPPPSRGRWGPAARPTAPDSDSRDSSGGD